MARILTYFAVVLFYFFLSSFQTMSQTRVDCSGLTDNFTQTYRSNRDTLLSDLRNSSSLGTYSNATTGLSPNTVYGMYLCRGDINRTSCSNCVRALSLEAAKSCNSDKGGYIFNDECMVRYSNFSFFTLVEDVPSTARCYPTDSLDSPSPFFNQTIPGKIDELIIRASSPLLSPVPYFVEDQEHVTQLQGSYDLEAMVQCSPDLDPRNCTVCLRLAMDEYSDYCNHARFAHIIFPKCLIKYNITTMQTSLGVSVTKGNGIYGRTFIVIMIALVLSLMCL